MEYMESHSILWEYHGALWSLYHPMVFHGSFHGLTRAIFMECIEFHGTPCHTTGTMAFHGGIHGFTYGISMKYMESHGIYGNTTALHGDTMASWYPMEILIGLHVEFS